MPLCRRQLLAVIGISALTGCVPDPTIHGGPAAAVLPEPTQPPVLEDLAAGLATVVQALSGEELAWREAAIQQLNAFLTRLRQVDPLSDDEPVFPEAVPATMELPQALSTAVDAASSALGEASGQAMRLFQLSILAAVTGLSNPTTLPPRTEGAAPAHFVDVPVPQATAAALSHVLALQQGLERGLGVLPKQDPQVAVLTGRWDEVRFLRNRLTDSLGADRPRQDAHYQLPEIPDATGFATAWAVLEVAVLDALLRMAATDAVWLDPALAQVSKAQAAGGQLPLWPGWSSR